MANLFDGLQDTMFNTVTKTFGYQATWQPSSGDLQLADVLYKDATQTAKLLDQEYDPRNCMIEYKESDFVGLKSLVDASHEIKIKVNELDYGVMKITSKYDGKTMIALLVRLQWTLEI